MRLIHCRTGIDLISLVRALVRMGQLLKADRYSANMFLLEDLFVNQSFYENTYRKKLATKLLLP